MFTPQRGRFEADLSDELRTHIDHRADDLVREGLTRDEAERRARVEFGAIERYERDVRRERTVATIVTKVDHLWGDARIALRHLRAAPLFTVFSIGTLALGIGVTTAAYSFIYSLVWQPVGVRERDRIVVVHQWAGYQLGFSGPELADVRDRRSVFDGVEAFAPFMSALSADGTSELVAGEAVSGGFFQLLGVEAVAGRLIVPRDDRSDAPAVIVLSEAVWRRRFGGDPGVVGRSLRMADRVFVVIGVAPSAFRGVSSLGRVPQSAWVPLSAAPGSSPGFRLDLSSRARQSLTLVARLAPGLTRDQAQSQLKPLAAQFDVLAPIDTGRRREPRSIHVASAFDDPRLRGTASEMARVVLALPALVLLVACTNLANLVLSRGASRRHEFAVRRALGAPRARLIRQQLLEGAMVAAAGGVAAVWLASQIMTRLSEFVRETFTLTPFVSAFEPRLAPEVLAAAGGFALLSFLVSSLVPALQLTRISDRTVLASDTGAGAAPRWRGRSNLIALQVSASVCMFLLTALGVTLLSTEVMVTMRPGLEQVAVAHVPFGIQQRDEARVRHTIARIREELRRAPEVIAVSVGSMADRSVHVHLATPQRPFDARGTVFESTWLSVATPNLFAVAGPPVVLGRSFTDRDVAGAPAVVILSRGLAGKVLGPGDPTGKSILARATGGGAVRTLTVVGITPDEDRGDGRVDRVAFVPYAQHFSADLAIYARGSGSDVQSIAMLLRAAIQRVDPDIAVTFAGRADRTGRWLQVVGVGLVTTLAGSLAAITLVLSMAGLFGVLSHVVSKRTRELGVRIALGADRRRITRLILKDGFRPVLEGLFIGLGAAVVLRIALQPAFTKAITPFDPIAFVMGAVPILIAAAIACYLPARRASRVEPNVVLKSL
jgi:putative ABC transport system permease protein